MRISVILKVYFIDIIYNKKLIYLFYELLLIEKQIYVI